MGIKSLVKQSLIARENRKYQKALNARRMTYADWQKMQAKSRVDIPFDLSEYVILIAEDAILAENALNRISTYVAQYPGVQIVYGDEDVAEESAECGYAPYFKPDWSPDLLDVCFYIGSMTVVHGRLLKAVIREKKEYRNIYGTGVSNEAGSKAATGQKSSIQVLTIGQEVLRRSLVKECILRAGGYEKRKPGFEVKQDGANKANPDGEVTIGHIPEILCHCKSLEVLEAYARPDVQLMVADGEHKVSVIIPSKDHPELVEKCIRAVMSTEKCLQFEVLVVDNGSSPENRALCEQQLGALVDEGVQLKYFYHPMEFNFSAMCNLGAEQAGGDLLLFLNDDVELSLENTVAAMAQKALQPYTGAVGLKLFYPNGKRIQHAGITNLPMGPVHKLQFMQDDEACYFLANKGSRNMLAVTAACLMVTADKFKEAGGFPENLQVAFNDVAFCFGLYRRGYYNVVLNDLYAYHHESLSRGDDESDAKLKRLLQEKAQLYTMYPELEGVDPYYSVNLSRVGLDTRIRPAYETGGNVPVQMACAEKCTELKGYRRDNCLMVRVENCSSGEIAGYAVVLGDDNACYEMKLLFCSVTEEKDSGADAAQLLQGEVYQIPMAGQYRPDLVENMPDQINVGLCGFWLRTEVVEQHSGRRMAEAVRKQEGFPTGRYRIGVAARNRVTGTKLLNFSNRILEINGRDSGRM